MCVHPSLPLAALGSPYLASKGNSFPEYQIIDAVDLKNFGVFVVVILFCFL